MKLSIEESKVTWYKVFIESENNHFERRFREILSKFFSISLILNPKTKVYKWRP